MYMMCLFIQFIYLVRYLFMCFSGLLSYVSYFVCLCRYVVCITSLYHLFMVLYLVTSGCYNLYFY